MLRNARETYLIEFKRILQNWFERKQIDYKDRSKLSRSKIQIYLFKCIYVLRVIPEKFSMFFYTSYKSMTWAWIELTRVNFPGKFEKRPGIPAEIVNVKHGLRVG